MTDVHPDKDRRWYLRKPGEDVHQNVHAYVTKLVQDSSRRELLRAWRAIYADDSDPSGATWYHRSKKLRHDVVSNAVGALHARITKAEPAPWVVTQGGAKDTQERAQKLTDWANFKFDEVDAYEVGADACHDALLYGTGILFPTIEDGAYEVETNWVGDYVVDPREEQHRRVRTAYRIRFIDRQVLKERYPKHKDAIETATNPLEDEEYTHADDEGQNADLVLAVEGWHIVKGPKSERKGRHCIVVSGCTLLHEEYERPYFPWVEIRYERDPDRYFGIGLVERLAGMQSEINLTQAKLSDTVWLWAPSVWVPDGGKINIEAIDNTPWKVHRYQGQTPPTFNANAGVGGDFIAYKQHMIDAAYESRGISRLFAESKKAPGLNSGKALTVHQDIESERFQPLGKSYERMFVDLTTRMMDLAEDAMEDGETDALVAIGGEEWLEALDFRELHVDRHKRAIRVTPASALSQAPAGRLQEVQDMIAAGFIDIEEGRELMNMPDTRAAMRVKMMAKEQADKLIMRALSGKEATPHAYLPLAYTHKTAVLHLNGRLTELDDNDEVDEGLERLTDFIAMVELEMERAGMPIPGKPQPAPAGPDPAAQMGAPMDPAAAMGPPVAPPVMPAMGM